MLQLLHPNMLGDDLGSTSSAMAEAKNMHNLLVKSTGLVLTAGVASLGQVRAQCLFDIVLHM